MNSKYIRKDGEIQEDKYIRISPADNRYMKSQDKPESRYIRWAEHPNTNGENKDEEHRKSR